MYKIIGADHNEYGPSSADEIRQWIKEGRADGRTRVKAEGTNEWKPLASFPEFADALSVSPSATLPAGPVNVEVLAAQILAASPDLPIGQCLSQGWKLLMSNFGLLFGATILVCLVEQGLLYIPLVGIVALFFKGVFYGGLYMVFLKRIRGQSSTVGEGFSGFGERFGQLLLVGVVGSLLTFAGFVCCLVPGLFLYVAWVFAVPLVADKRLGFWDALQLSRKVVTAYWFQVLMLLVLAFLPVVLFAIYHNIASWNFISSAIQSGQLDFSLWQKDPTAFRAQAEHFRALYFEHFFPWMLTQQFILLLVQPFGKAVMMQAYEVLFNPRPKPPA